MDFDEWIRSDTSLDAVRFGEPCYSVRDMEKAYNAGRECSMYLWPVRTGSGWIVDKETEDRERGPYEDWIKTGAAYRKEKGEAKNKEKIGGSEDGFRQ